MLGRFVSLPTGRSKPRFQKLGNLLAITIAILVLSIAARGADIVFCENNDECPSDVICVAWGGWSTCGGDFGQSCEEDNDCGGNLFCMNGVCDDDGPGDCGDDEDYCNSYGYSCNSAADECEVSAGYKTFGQVCGEDDDCAGDYTFCVENTCAVEDGDTCLTNQMCAATSICTNYVCTKVSSAPGVSDSPEVLETTSDTDNEEYESVPGFSIPGLSVGNGVSMIVPATAFAAMLLLFV